jgi:branched-chain amino acid transport system substrate-binding protein
MSQDRSSRVGGGSPGARLRTLVLLLATGLVALVLAACGSSGSKSSQTNSTPTSATNAAPATAKHPARGSAVVLGTVDFTDQPEFTDAVKATASFLNAEGGGLLGHRVEIRTCSSDATPQQDIKCANDLVRAHAVAVVIGEDRSADSAFPVYQRAGVPVITPRVVTTQELVNPVAVALGAGIPGVLAALGKYAHDTLHATSAVTVTVQGIPQGLLDALVGAPLKAAGIKSSYAFFAPDNPDFTSTFTAAAQKKPNLLISDIDDNRGCVPAMNALRSIGASFKVFQILCSDDSVIKAAGPLADGELFYGPNDAVTGIDSPDARTYRHIIQTYSSKKSLGFATSLAVSAMMTIQRVVQKQGGTAIGPKSILTAFDKSRGQSIYMGPPLQCGQLKAFPRLCTAAMRIFTAKNGKKVPVTGYISAPQYLPKG